MITSKLVAGVGVFAGAFLVTSLAHATPRPLPITYIYETLGEGEAEVEQYADVSPANALSSQGKRLTYLGSQFQTEFEYGITDRLELGLYVTLAPSYADQFTQTSPMIEGNGIKQRLRYRFADEGVLPIDMGVYGELTENERFISFEGKLILQKKFGNLRVDANLVGEYEKYFTPNHDWEIMPSAGMVYQVTPMFQPGIEYWVNAEWPDSPSHATPNRPEGTGPNHYLGPTVLLEFGRLWWSTGAYLRLNDAGHPQRDLQANGTHEYDYTDPFGPVYFRTVVGYSL